MTLTITLPISPFRDTLVETLPVLTSQVLEFQAYTITTILYSVEMCTQDSVCAKQAPCPLSYTTSKKWPSLILMNLKITIYWLSTQMSKRSTYKFCLLSRLSTLLPSMTFFPACAYRGRALPQHTALKGRDPALPACLLPRKCPSYLDAARKINLS